MRDLTHCSRSLPTLDLTGQMTADFQSESTSLMDDVALLCGLLAEADMGPSVTGLVSELLRAASHLTVCLGIWGRLEHGFAALDGTPGFPRLVRAMSALVSSPKEAARMFVALAVQQFNTQMERKDNETAIHRRQGAGK